jgi:hypothetical protein
LHLLKRFDSGAELEEQKVPQYLLALLLNHPATSVELKAQIALSTEYIIKIET